MQRQAMKISLTNEDIVKQKENNAMDNFFSSIKTKATRVSYLHYVERVIFSCESMLEGKTLEELANAFIKKSREEPAWTKGVLLAYLNKLKVRCMLEKTDENYLNPSSVPNHFKSIKKLLDSNEIVISFRAIKDSYPEQDNITEGRAYTREEIQLMIQNARDCITRFAIYTMSSSGIRKGAWDGLTWGDFKTVYKVESTEGKEPKYKTELKDGEKGEVVCGALLIYRGTKEQYTALISYEAWAEGEACRTLWGKKMHKRPTDDDPLLLKSRNLPMSSATIRDRVYTIVNGNKIRKLKEGKKLYEVPLMHGFRRYFNRVFSDNQEGTIGGLVIRERLMGHKGITKTEANYYWDTLEDKVKSYLKVMPELTISELMRTTIELSAERKEKAELKEEIKEKDKALRDVSELRAKVDRIIKQQAK